MIFIQLSSLVLTLADDHFYSGTDQTKPYPNHRLDPKQKRWKRELVCDECRRWAAALTLLKPGDVWDQQEWTHYLVGKRLCNNCIPRYVGLIVQGYNPKAKVTPFFRVPLLIATGLFIASIVAFNIASLSKPSPVIPSILFLVALAAFYGSFSGSRAIAKLGVVVKRVSLVQHARPSQDVSIAGLFNGPTETN